MTRIAKINPDDFEVAEFSLLLPSKGDRNISQGEEIFIWTSETAGGRGLFARGISAHSVTEHDQHLIFENLMLLSAGIYGIAEIEPFRDVRDETLASFLAEKLYYYSHRRVLSIPSPLATELRTRFLSHFGTF